MLSEVKIYFRLLLSHYLYLLLPLYLSLSRSLPTFCDKSCFCSAKQKGKLTQRDFGNTAFVVKSPPQGIVKNVPAIVLRSTEASKEIMESSCLKVFRGYESC